MDQGRGRLRSLWNDNCLINDHGSFNFDWGNCSWVFHVEVEEDEPSL